MGHDPWVVWVMGHVFDGSRGSWVTLYDPFAALSATSLSGESGTPPLQNIPRLACDNYKNCVESGT